MEEKKITLTLADGTQLVFSGLNGSNLIVPDKQEMDESAFTDDNLKSCAFTDEDGNSYEYRNLSFIQQQKQLNGDYYICFHQKTELEVELDDIYELLIDLAEIEVDSGNLALTSVPDTFQDAVRIRIEDGKRLDK